MAAQGDGSFRGEAVGSILPRGLWGEDGPQQSPRLQPRKLEGSRYRALATLPQHHIEIEGASQTVN